MHKTLIAILTLHAFVGLSIVAPAAQAGVVTTGEYLQQVEVEDKRAEILTRLQREDVRDQLSEMGVDSATVEQRVAALSDAEVLQMASEMEAMPAGGDAAGTLFTLLLVLLVLELLGVIDVFPGISSA